MLSVNLPHLHRRAHAHRTAIFGGKHMTRLRRRNCPRPTAGIFPAIAGILFALTICGAWSQTTRPIKNIVPVPAGSTQDILARLLADEIGRTQGATMVTENRPGAGTAIAAEAASHALPDGSTLLSNAPPFLINPQLRKAAYDPLTGFEPICYLARSPTVIVVNSASPYRTLADLLNAARANPGELTLAGIGPASAIQIAFEALKRAAKSDMTFIPYPGTTPAVNALLGAHVTSVFGNYGDVAAQMKAGKLRALAAASSMRIDSLPDLPTIAESGYPEYEADIWYGLVAPAKTPKESISKLAGWIAAALRVPEIKDKLAIQGLYPVGLCGADFGAFMRKQYIEYGRVIQEANIKEE
jgi:tripartite-type tricarboxylate transporter receptor subunit TctC